MVMMMRNDLMFLDYFSFISIDPYRWFVVVDVMLGDDCVNKTKRQGVKIFVWY